MATGRMAGQHGRLRSQLSTLYKHVIVHWYDAGAGESYTPPDAAMKLSYWQSHTAGWLYYEDDVQIKVSMEYHVDLEGDELLRDCKAIPRISILLIEEFDKGKEYWRHP